MNEYKRKILQDAINEALGDSELLGDGVDGFFHDRLAGGGSNIGAGSGD